jgi:hypothetical protein
MAGASGAGSMEEWRWTMKDIIVGRVSDVIDAETITLQVTQVVRNRYGKYEKQEKIRFKTLQHSYRTFEKIGTKGFVEALLRGNGVMCLVIGRDAHGSIEADVYALGH